jgi:hypothetical protein
VPKAGARGERVDYSPVDSEKQLLQVVAASDFSGPLARQHRSLTDFASFFILIVGWGVALVCIAMPYFIGHPDWNRLSFGTNYEGLKLLQLLLLLGAVTLPPTRARTSLPDNICRQKYLYPILRNGVGVCVDKCPSKETAYLVDALDANETCGSSRSCPGLDVFTHTHTHTHTHSSEMICMKDTAHIITKHTTADGTVEHSG